MSSQSGDERQTQILELNKRDLRVIGQMLHMYLSQVDGTNKAVEAALQHISEQTDCVHMAAKDHGVYGPIVPHDLSSTVLNRLQTTKPVSFLPYEKDDS